MPIRPIFEPKHHRTVLLTEEQLKEFFLQNDADGDGRLSKEDLKKSFQKLGAFNPGWRVRRALVHAKPDKDGLIDSNELDEVVKYAVKLGYHTA